MLRFLYFLVMAVCLDAMFWIYFDVGIDVGVGFYIFIAVFFVFVGLLGVDKEKGLSLFNLFFALYVFYYVVGVLYDYLAIGRLRDGVGVVVFWGFLFVLLGFSSVKPISQQRMVLLSPAYSLLKLRFFLILALVFSSCAAVVWFLRIGTIPIFNENVEFARVELAQGTFINRQLISVFIPFFLFYIFELARQKNAALKDKYLLVWGGGIGSFLLISQGYRTFLLSFWLISLLVYQDVRPTHLPIKRVLPIFFGVLILVFSFGFYRFYSSDGGSVDDRSALELLMHIFWVRPYAVEQLWSAAELGLPSEGVGIYLRGLGFLIPGADQGVGMWLKEDVLQQEFSGAGYNPGLIGEFILGFGVENVLFCMFFYGATLRVLEFLSVEVSGSAFMCTIKSILQFYLLLSLSPGISTSLFSIATMLISVIFAHLILVSKFRC